jgi:hypothetical protein
VNFDLSKADIELVVEVLRIEEVSEAFEGLRSDIVEGWWEDIVIGLWSKMEGSKRLVCLLLKGVGRSGSDGTVLVIVVVGGDDDVVWRVEVGMEEAVGSLYVLSIADVTLAVTVVGTRFFCARSWISDARRWVCEVVARASRVRCGLVWFWLRRIAGSVSDGRT